MSEAALGLLKGRVTDIADPIIDGAVAIITLVVFALIIPIIVKVLGTVSTTGAQVNQIESAVNALSQTPVGQGLPKLAGGVIGNIATQPYPIGPLNAGVSYMQYAYEVAQAYYGGWLQALQRYQGQGGNLPSITNQRPIQKPLSLVGMSV